MSSILDHVEQAVPRATVYGAMKGSPVFIGKYFREVNPASNAPNYKYSDGERRITFILASPDKTIFSDLRSAYLRFDIGNVAYGAAAGTDANKISEPGSNFIERIVIKMNGTVVEDISRFDRLTSFFKRKLITRNQKNARTREGYDWVANQRPGAAAFAVYADGDALDQNQQGGLTDAAVGDAIADNGITEQQFRDVCAQLGNNIAARVNTAVDAVTALSNGEQTFGANGSDIFTAEDTNITGAKSLCVKLDLSGIMNIQQLLSGYYSPLEIDLYLQNPAICCSSRKGEANDRQCTDYEIKQPRLCLDQIVMSPEYVSAFEAALLANSSAQGIQIPFTTYYNYVQRIRDDVTYWIRKPVRYLKAIYWGAIQSDKANNGNYDSYRFCRTTTDNTGTLPSARIGSGGHVADGQGGTDAQAMTIDKYQISIGTKNYREIDDRGALTDAYRATMNCNESDVMFAKAVGHYNDYATEDASLNSLQRVYNNQCQGLDLEFSPDNDVLASETTLNSNDVRLKLTVTRPGSGNAADAELDVYAFLQYQASIALFPGNETRLLVT